jgi:hypothetical protein
VSLTCYMCEAAATSQEHAPPACLFPESKAIGRDLRRNLVTVPSCDLHNSKKSEDDEFFRATLCLASAEYSEVAQHQFFGKILRGVRRSPAKYGAYAPRANIPTPEGKSAFTTDPVRFEGCIDHLTRALCFHTYGMKWHLPIYIVSPHTMELSPRGELAPPEPALEAVRTTRAVLASAPVRGENGEVFLYRLLLQDGVLAFGALFYGFFEVFCASFPDPRRVTPNNSSKPTPLRGAA